MRRDSAVVVGGSVAGMIAARALADTFGRVTIIERDDLPDHPAARPGAPQSSQVHVCLPAGLEMFEQMLPGFIQELRDAGCPEWDELCAVPALTSEGWRVRAQSPAIMLGFRRSLFEYHLRRRVLSNPRCEVRTGVATELAATDDRSGVVGVALKSGEVITADLVVDACGRNSHSPEWYRQLGYQAPDEVEVRVYMGYASQTVRVPEGVLPDGISGINVMPYPGQHKGGSLTPCDNGTHILLGCGMMKDYPPNTADNLLDYLDQASSPLLGQIARQCEPLGRPVIYRMQGNRRRLWSKLKDRPAGIIHTGDAVSSFNPVYGQGMTAAAASATIMRRLLAENPTGAVEHGFEQRFQQELDDWSDTAFEIAAGVDCQFDGAEFINWTPPTKEEIEYGIALEQLATVDPDTLLALGQAQFFLNTDPMQSASMQSKVREWVKSGRATAEPDVRVFPPMAATAATTL